MRVIVFDIEIKTPIVNNNWDAALRGDCGVSAVVLYDSSTLRYHIYGEESLVECVDHLNSADLLVSFNGKNFDIPVLQAMTDLIIYPDHYDILDEIWKALGGVKHKGWNLGKVCPRTLGLEKTDTGDHAPTLVQKQHWATLFDYCLNDVHLTRMLYNHIAEMGYVVDPDGGLLHMGIPYEDALA